MVVKKGGADFAVRLCESINREPEFGQADWCFEPVWRGWNLYRKDDGDKGTQARAWQGAAKSTGGGRNSGGKPFKAGPQHKRFAEPIGWFERKGIQLVSLKEDIDTATPTGKLLVTVLSALSQFERDLIVQRTNEGLKAARARGRKGGRPKADQKAVEKAVKLYEAQTHSIKEITQITGISQATLYRALKQAVEP